MARDDLPDLSDGGTEVTGPRKKPPVVVPLLREPVEVVCPVCARTVHRMADGRAPWHVVDPSQWRGTWCAGSRKRAKVKGAG